MTLGVLVTIHELGHFVIARWSGVQVVRFSVGFGKPIWLRRDKHGTEFAIAAIPLGGYVRMHDDRDPSVPALQPGQLTYRQLNPWWRIAIALGGPVANFLLAIGVYWWLFIAGTTAVVPTVKRRSRRPLPRMPACPATPKWWRSMRSPRAAGSRSAWAWRRGWATPAPSA